MKARSPEQPQEIKDALALLEKHFGQPVLPVSEYCEAFETWIELAMPGLKQYLINIYKSNLLYRLIYCGEEASDIPCPIHQGHWSGCDFDKPCPEGCSYGFNITGWIQKNHPPIIRSTKQEDGTWKYEEIPWEK